MDIISIKKFSGGVDLSNNGHLQVIAKQLEQRTAGKLSIIKAKLPKKVVLSLGQCSGVCAVPIVSVGEQVLTGQLIAHNQTEFCTPVHSSISGKIIAIDDQPSNHASGIKTLAITIESDGLDKQAKHQSCGNDFKACELEVLIDYIHQSGIVGLGGAGFPTHIKLDRLKNCHTLIINGVECEPGVSCDNAIMQNYPQQLLQGIQILLYISKAKKAIIALEQHNKHTLAMLKKANNNPRIQLATMPDKYSSGDEKILIKSLLNTSIPKGKHSVDVGILCQNVSTVYAIYEAVIHQKPLTSRVVSIGGTGLEKKMVQNYQLRLGVSLADLIQQLPTKIAKNQKLDYQIGGLMMGKTVQNLSRTIDKVTSSLFINGSEKPQTQQACIRCGQCHLACPIHLLPQQLYWFTQAGQIDKAVDNYLLDCTKCNCCTVVCPSHIPLSHYFTYGQALYQKQQVEQQQSGIARERFEFRNYRLERNKVERKKLMAIKKAAIQKKMANDQVQKDKIQAALKRVSKKT